MATSASARSRNIDISPAIAAVRAYSRDVKIACDELHDDPDDVDARRTLLALLDPAAAGAVRPPVRR